MITQGINELENLELNPNDLYQQCNPDAFDFQTTADLPQASESMGQSRAKKALRFGIGIKHDGYNLFAFGSTGTGKRYLVEAEALKLATQQNAAKDLCYVNNFLEPQKPKALLLPAGLASQFKADMEKLIDEVKTVLPETFEGETYQARRQALDSEFQDRPDKAFDAIAEQAESKGFKMMSTPIGVVFAPLVDGKVLAPDAFNNLPKEKQAQFQEDIVELQEALQKVLLQVSRYKRELEEKIRELNREMTDNVLGHLIKEVQDKYLTYPDVIAYLEAVETDITAHTSDFIKLHKESLSATIPAATNNHALLRRYYVNILINNSQEQHAPIVYEDNPTFENLVGRIEHIAQMGTLVTDFHLIRPGALHKANGGYLILDARKVLQQPYAWEGLKRALKAKRIRIESLGQALSIISTVSLEPEDVAVNLKIVLLGDRLLYYLLCAYDPEFEELFKVAADFDDDIERNPNQEQVYAQFLASVVQQAKLRPLDRKAVARVIEHSSRLASDARKLSANITTISDLLTEADYYAEQEKRTLIEAVDIQKAIDEQIARTARFRDRMLESTLRDIRLIATEGEQIGQVNALSVIQVGRTAFGHPSRITARVRLGKGDVVDIEREVDMGGPIHSKGVMILSSYLGAHYASTSPLSLKASLVFEQSYGGVEGDSATCAELCALVSAIGHIPIKQSLAITGSMNQNGQVQAIGGVNEKIEGFYDLCQARGLTAKQGVLIPKANVQHLMLRSDIVTAVREGQFHIFGYTNVEEALGLLTGLEPGIKDEQGRYPATSLNALVHKELEAMTAAQLELARKARLQSEEE